MNTIKTNSEFLDIRGEIYENNKRVTTIDEQTEQHLFEVELVEEVDASVRPKVLAVSGFNILMECKIVDSIGDVVVGVVPFGRKLINTKYNIVKQGIIKDHGLVGGTLNQDVYVNSNGEMTLDYDFFKIGRLVQVDVPIVYVNVGEEKSQDLSFSNGFSNLESPNKNLETALRKINFYSNKSYIKIDTGLNSLQDVVWGNGIFVAVADNGTQSDIKTSTDGVNWTTRSLLPSGSYAFLKRVLFGNGIFFAMGTDGISPDNVKTYWSIDGINWSDPRTFGSKRIFGIATPTGFYIPGSLGAPPNSSIFIGYGGFSGFPANTATVTSHINTGFEDKMSILYEFKNRTGYWQITGARASGNGLLNSDYNTYLVTPGAPGDKYIYYDALKMTIRYASPLPIVYYEDSNHTLTQNLPVVMSACSDNGAMAGVLNGTSYVYISKPI
jgi:hypothetical protein